MSSTGLIDINPSATWLNLFLAILVYMGTGCSRSGRSSLPRCC